MGFRRALEAVATRICRLPSALAAGAAVDHPSNGGITGDAFPDRDTESDADEQESEQEKEREREQTDDEPFF